MPFHRSSSSQLQDIIALSRPQRCSAVPLPAEQSPYLLAGHLLGVHRIPPAAQLCHRGHVHDAVVQVRMQPGHESPQEGGVHMHRVASQARLPGPYVLRHKAQDLGRWAGQALTPDHTCTALAQVLLSFHRASKAACALTQRPGASGPGSYPGANPRLHLLSPGLGTLSIHM